MEEKGMKDFAAFRNGIVYQKKRNMKVRNSMGVYDIYKLIRKAKWLDIGRPLKEHEFYSIVRGVNNLLAEELGKGSAITLPSRMGSLEVRMFHPTARFAGGKLRVTYPVDWDKTLKLWYADEEARAEKTLVRMEEDTVYMVKYNKHNANYENQSFYSFTLNHKIKQRLKENIRAGKVSALYEKYQTLW